MAMRLDEGVPPRFLVEDLATWPDLRDRMELVEGRPLFAPPCADYAQDVAISVAVVLGSWAEAQALEPRP